MENYTIKTNNQYREILSFFELTDKEQEEIKDDYDTIEESSFFRYKGQVYDMANFVRTEHNLKEKGWHGMHGTSYFTAILVALSSCGDMVKVGYLY